jgi:hypothetical protein
MTSDGEIIITPEDRKLFSDIARDIKNKPSKYREAGKWLDEYCSENDYWQRQKDELAQLREKEKILSVSMFVRRASQLEKEIQTRRTPALLIRFQEARNYLLEKYKDQQFVPEDDAKRIFIITWLLTDPDTEKANLNITELERWPWEPIDDVSKLSRGYANFLWFYGGGVYDPWINLVRIAWSKLKDKRKGWYQNRTLKTVLIGIIVAIIGGGGATWIGIFKGCSDEGRDKGLIAVFDAKGTIHYDGGAMEYLAKIEVQKSGTVTYDGGKEWYVNELEIVVTPKQYLSHAPLIEPLGGQANMRIYDGERGEGYEWVYQVLIRPPYIKNIETQKFKLEILK